MNREHGVQYQAQISMNWLCSTVEFSCWKQVPKICPALLFFLKKAYILIRLNLGFVQSRSLCFNSEHGENLPMCCIRSSFWGWLGEFPPLFLSFYSWVWFTVFDTAYSWSLCKSFSKFCLCTWREVHSLFLCALHKKESVCLQEWAFYSLLFPQVNVPDLVLNWFLVLSSPTATFR